MAATPTNQPQAPKSNTKRAIWIAVAIAVPLLLLGILGTTLVVRQLSGQNWSLGLGPQKSSAEIEMVQSSIEAIGDEAIIDVVVKNANTSGTPFGHSIRVNVLIDVEKFNAVDKVQVEWLTKEVVDAIKASGVKDTFDITIGLNINPMVTSGPGAPDNPLTSAQRMSGSYYLYDEKLKVE